MMTARIVLSSTSPCLVSTLRRTSTNTTRFLFYYNQQQRHCTGTMNPPPTTSSGSQEAYDAHAKEAALRAASESWDTTHVDRTAARNNDDDDDDNNDDDEIPRIDLRHAEHQVVQQLRRACTHVGFYYLLGHGISDQQRSEIFAAVREFHNLPSNVKEKLRMDRQGFPVGGVGYLPFHHRKLPTRKKGNANEAFIVKRQTGKTVNIDLQDNQWPSEAVLPGFREKVIAYANAMEQLALKLLPLYAKALDLDPQFFDEAFTRPMYRLRMTKYPPVQAYEAEEFGIAPHVDTSFFTLLDQDSPGLVIFSEQRKCWIQAPLVEGALIVNTGELLRQWTNDMFLSVKHFANHNTELGASPRYSIPFFFNANADYRMHCIPTCCSEDCPPKYPPFSYEESQAIAQGE